MPLITVLSAAYAPSAAYLEEAMGSVISQDLPTGWELEWVVQEDGDEPRLASRVGDDDRIKYAANRAALGIAPTRNLALSRAAGDLVQVLDHDDVLLPNALATIIRAFDNPGIHWAIGQADDLMPDGSRVRWESALPFGHLSAGAVNKWAVEHAGNWPIHCAGLMIRAASLRAMGGWAGLPYDDDTVMFACLSEIADGYNEPSVTWLYRQHEAQVTKSDARRIWSESARRVALQRAASARASGLRFDATAIRETEDIHAIEVGAPIKGHP